MCVCKVVTTSYTLWEWEKEVVAQCFFQGCPFEEALRGANLAGLVGITTVELGLTIQMQRKCDYCHAILF